MSTDNDLIQEKAAIAQARAELDQREEALAAKERARLTTVHRELVAKCRVAKQEHERLAAETEQLQREAFSARGKCENAEANLANAKASRPQPENYPTEEELRQFAGRVRRCETLVFRAQAEEREIVSKLEPGRFARNAAKEKLDRLADQEADLRAKLDPPQSQHAFATVTRQNHGVTIASNGHH